MQLSLHRFLNPCKCLPYLDISLDITKIFQFVLYHVPEVSNHNENKFLN